MFVNTQESVMQIDARTMKFGISALGLMACLAAGARPALAQTHAHEAEEKSVSAAKKSDASELVAIIRAATEPFKDVEVAKNAGYELQFGCVSGESSGAMGMHFVNFPLVLDGELDPTRPEIVIYEPKPDGSLKLVGADFLVLAAAWNEKHASPPQLGGQLFHLFEAPNRFGLPAFYTLHVWAWKDSPTGTFVNWHSNISCDAFNGDKH
jgi:hypothetical protein